MKLGFLSTNLFWGTLLIVFGISAILRSFNINIPLFRIVLALLLIYVGVSLLLGHKLTFEGNENITIFNESYYSFKDIKNREINVIFGKGIVDLTDYNFKGNNINELEINSIFSTTEIRISKNNPVKITASSAFASVTMPDKSSIVFGETTYESSNKTVNGEDLSIKSNSVFANLDIIFID